MHKPQFQTRMEQEPPKLMKFFVCIFLSPVFKINFEPQSQTRMEQKPSQKP
jgi:hypothetical protein